MEYTIENVVLVMGFIVGIYIIIKFLIKTLQDARKRKLVQKRIYLSRRIRIRADRKFNKLLNKFKREHKHKPTKNDLFRIVISASHITIRRRGAKGHWGRQKVRKYLLEKHEIVKEFTMQ